MANLAIQGHISRGKEVIEILKMLGGKDVGYSGSGSQYYYYIDEYGNITGTSELSNSETFVTYTLEKFLEKFPYKVGDKVIYEDKVRKITKMVWEERTNTVAYKLDDKLYCNVINKLQPYKEETMEEIIKMNPLEMSGARCIIPIPKGYEFAGVDDDAQQVVFDKVKPKYPKTEIKEKLEKILSLYKENEERCGGYEMTRHAHLDAPEDYVESRTDWDTIRDRAEDMYYMLDEIKFIVEQCNELI